MGFVMKDKEIAQVSRRGGTNWKFVAGSAKQRPYVLIEWNRGEDHIHMELDRFASSDEYTRMYGNTYRDSGYEYSIGGFHIKVFKSGNRDEEVHDYIGFDYAGGGVWNAAWAKEQTQDLGRNRFFSDPLGDEVEGRLMNIAREFLADVKAVTGESQKIGTTLTRP